MSAHELIHWCIVGGVGLATVKSGRSGKLYGIRSQHGCAEECSCDAGRRFGGCSHIRFLREELHRQLTTGAQSSPESSAAPQPVTAAPLASSVEEYDRKFAADMQAWRASNPDTDHSDPFSRIRR